MVDFTYIDIYETSWMEFVLVIFFLLVTVAFWRYLMGSGKRY